MGSQSHNSRSRRPRAAVRDDGDVSAGTPARRRELRAQGRKTMRKLSDAGMRVFAERGYHQCRVDDIVRAARTSHGTFYLYFANKEDLLRSLAVECAQEIEQLARAVGPIDSGPEGYEALRTFLDAFLTTYRRYGVVIRAWMEDQVSDREVDRLGVAAFTHIAEALAASLASSGERADPATVAALMALLERFSYAIASRDLGLDDTVMLDTLTRLIHRGFFGAPLAA
jgi:AcrR family transcriptional regulator